MTKIVIKTIFLAPYYGVRIGPYPRNVRARKLGSSSALYSGKIRRTEAKLGIIPPGCTLTILDVRRGRGADGGLLAEEGEVARPVGTGAGVEGPRRPPHGTVSGG